MNNSNKCIVCGELYDSKETIRIFGDMHWTYNQCSAQCHTKYIMTFNFFISEIEDNLAFADVDLEKKEIERLARVRTMKIIEIFK